MLYKVISDVTLLINVSMLDYIQRITVVSIPFSFFPFLFVFP